jgi:superfamily II DNA helicase RecQ
VPVYAVFTNEQLAKMVTGGVVTKAALEKIDGVGEAKATKYGAPGYAAGRARTGEGPAGRSTRGFI